MSLIEQHDTTEKPVEQEICELQQQLECSASPIGDWKYVKYMESGGTSMTAQELAEYRAKREAVRVKIRELKLKLNANL